MDKLSPVIYAMSYNLGEQSGSSDLLGHLMNELWIEVELNGPRI